MTNVMGNFNQANTNLGRNTKINVVFSNVFYNAQKQLFISFLPILLYMYGSQTRSIQDPENFG